jgi:prepilin-type N-terminal cleavage/methylation domain-containing protein
MRTRATTRTSRRGPARGFTLIELAVAMLLVSVLMFVALPRFAGVAKSPMARALSDLEEAFTEARARAILGNRPMQVVIYGAAGEILVEPAPEGVMGATNGVRMASFEAFRGIGPEAAANRAPFHARLHEEVAFRRLTVNSRDMMTAELAAIRFFPNGTSDAMEGELSHLRNSAQLKRLTLEVMTARLDIEDLR